MVLDKMHARAKVSEDRILFLSVLNAMRLYAFPISLCACCMYVHASIRIPNFVC